MLKKSILEFITYSVICGILYPCLIYACGSLLFSQKINGSLVYKDEKIVGSNLVGQSFSNANYFWGRPSATAPSPYSGLSSGATNIALSNPSFKSTLEERVKNFSYTHTKVPVDLVTASGSGLDPDISIVAAKFQARRIAESRQIPLHKVLEIIEGLRQNKILGFMGTQRVNVLLLNLELDREVLRNALPIN